MFSGKHLGLLIASFVACACTAYKRGTDGIPASSVAGEFRVYPNEVYAKPGGLPLTADVFVPSTTSPPAGFAWVVLIHGGGWRNGNKEQMTPIAERLARAGFGVVNISYRLSGAATWPAAIEDCRAAVRWARAAAAKFRFDPTRAASFGYSAGAHLALLLAYMPQQDLAGQPLRAVVDGAGPVNLSDFPESPLVRAFMGAPFLGHEDLYRDASPLTYVRPAAPPTFVYFGENDWIVDAEQSRKLIAALRKARVAVDTHEAFFGHVATFLFDEEHTEMAVEFLRKHTK